jgi:hypothetical protein
MMSTQVSTPKGSAARIGRGETLPLFGYNADASDRSVEAENHMHTAIRLSKALKQGAVRDRARRPQVAKAICDHLLASLRIQAELERAQRKASSRSATPER